MSTQAIDTILEFWLGPEEARHSPSPEASRRWWTKDVAFDGLIRDRFGADVRRAGDGELDAWAGTPRGRLALVILVDQFTRNIFRNSAKMYEHDARAVKLALDGIVGGDHHALSNTERQFLYMPLMHAESLELQDQCVALFEVLARNDAEWTIGALDFARRHRDVVARFGRFPHRNAILGRTSTADEVQFLTEPGSSF